MESVQGFSSAFGASLFAAAASFTRASPWESLDSRRPIQFTYRLVLKVSLVVVVGEGENNLEFRGD